MSSFTGEANREMSPISEAIVKPVITDPRSAHQQRDVAMIGAGALELALDLADPPLEIIDQPQAGLDVAAPGSGISRPASSSRPATPNRSDTGH